MRWLGVLATFSVSVSGCGQTEGQPSAPSGGSAAGGQVGANSTGGAGAKSAGGAAGKSGVGGAAVSSAGSANAGAGGAESTAAGGVGEVAGQCTELFGGWWGICNHVQPVEPVPPCWDLKLNRYPDGGLEALTSYPLPETADFYLRFAADGYSAVWTNVGPVQLTYADSCLATVDPKPSCDELVQALTETGNASANFRDVACAPTLKDVGGCDCTFQVDLIGGDFGVASCEPVSSDPAGGSSMTLTSMAHEPDKPQKVTFPYYKVPAGLHLSLEVEKLWRDAAVVTYVPVDCHDGKRGPGELDVDCGHACEGFCSQ
jgi:hypothetical protein